LSVDIGRFSVEIGRFRVDIGRFWVDIGRFWVDIGRFWVDIGRFSSILAFFSRYCLFCVEAESVQISLADAPCRRPWGSGSIFRFGPISANPRQFDFLRVTAGFARKS
jgi:hypothetical protein